MKLSIAVIMTVHNRRDATLECIGNFYSCYGIEEYKVDFYLMDDGCTDGTPDAVTASFPKVKVIKGDGNLFWNRGMYYCWKEAVNIPHDFYLWLNDDTMLFKDALDVLFSDYSKAGQMSIITGCCCDTETKSQATYGGRNSNRKVQPSGNPQEIIGMNGNVVLIPNAVYERVGLNDPYYHHAIGDFEYGYRARKEGVRVLLSSQFVATCDRHDSDVKCFSSNYSLKERFKYLYSIRYNAWEQLHCSWKYESKIKALKTFAIQNYRTLFVKKKMTN